MIVSKGEFARMVGKSPQAISNWISDGKLTKPALVGEGRSAQVDVELAKAQLGITLDLGQQLATEKPLLQAVPAAADGVSDDQQRLLKARADIAEREARLAEAKEHEHHGRWVETVATREAWSQEMATLVQATETWLMTNAAPEVLALVQGGAGLHKVAQKLQAGFRDLRARLAEQAGQALAA